VRRAISIRAAAILGSLALGCTPPRPDVAAPPPPAEAPPDVPFAESPLFLDAAAELGLRFAHVNGMTGRFYYSEMMGAGAALIDIDNDGDLDLYLVQGGPLDAGAVAESPTDRLFRNDLTVADDGAARLSFTDVTAESGIVGIGYGMGVAAGDFDNDGWIDLYVTNFGPNRMLRNDGDGTFSDVTAAAATDDPRWSVSAAFVDYDHDGWLDLYVGNYVDFTISGHRPCHSPAGAPDYCGPRSYRPETDRLFRNRGDGTFEDVSVSAGIASQPGSTLGVLTADFDGDGWLDVYVANDQMPNRLWRNQGNGTFHDDALMAGCALNRDGATESSMGVDAADFDGDGDEDLFMTHLAGETNTIYVNDGRGWFEDQTIQTRLGVPSRPFTGFGVAWFDYDGDGWLDLLAVNGAVQAVEALAAAGDPYPLHQPNQLFRNLGRGRFDEVTAAAGPAFALSEVSRGAAFGDVDNDGDPDVLIANNNGPVRLLLNQRDASQRWLGLRLIGRDMDRDMLGARVMVLLGSGRELWRRVRTDGSYGSANDPRVLFGLGDESSARIARVHWPGGRVEQWDILEIDRYRTLRKGTGEAVRHRRR